MDQAGFIYSLSNKDSSSYQNVIELAKYNSAGSCLWRQIYFNPDSQNAEATCMVCDSNGNLYIGGYEWVTNQGYDYLVLKYNTAGNLLWTFHYNGVANESDQLYAIAVDNHGNCYVSGAGGLSGQPNFYTDALTCKIDSSGNQVWDRYYNYPMDSITFDQTMSLRINSNNDLLLAGQFNDEYGVCKYDSSGNLIWTSQPFPFSTYTMDIDDSSNIYLAKGGSGQVATAIKIDSSGITQWSNNISYPYSTTLQSITTSGSSIYATGSTKISAAATVDVLTIKYDLNGDTVWTRLYNTPANINDRGNKIIASQNTLSIIGNSGTGYPNIHLLILRYDSSGSLQWNYEDIDSTRTQYDQDALIDQTGSVVTATSTDLYVPSYELVSVSGAGSFQWNDFRENFQSHSDFAQKNLIDSGGNLVVGGNSSGRTSSQEICFLKYTPAGNALWETRIRRNNGCRQILSQVITNLYDEIFFCGSVDTFWGAGEEDVLIGKLAPSGNIEWVKQFDATSEPRTLASSLAWHPDGHLYVLGYSLHPNNQAKKVYLMKLDSLGNLLWEKPVADSSLADAGECFVFDNSWNLYAAYRGLFNGQSNLAVTKLDTAGTVTWTQRYSGPDLGTESCTKLMIDHNQDIIVSGFSDSSSWDMVVIKYDLNGNYLWHYRYAGPAGTWDRPSDMAIDDLNNIYVTGGSCDADFYDDCFTFKLDPSGNHKWEARYAGTYGVPVDFGNAIATGHGGRTMVTGHTYDADGTRKILVLVYDSLGATIFSELFNLPAGSSNNEFGADVICDQNGSFYITGQTESWASMADFITLKYTDFVLGVNSEQKLKEKLNVYPNPFTGLFDATIFSTLKETGTYQLFNSMGTKIAERKIELNKGMNSFHIDDINFKNGIYFFVLRLSSGDLVSQRVISIN